jgi:plastocyanin
MVNMRTSAAAAVLCLVAGAASAQTGAGGGVGAGVGVGVIKGRVLVRGTPPPSRKVPVSADPQCKAQHPEGLEISDFAVSGGGLADVLVYLRAGVKGNFPPPAAPVVLDQKGCEYAPGLIALQAGQTLKIRNSDATLHNVHFRPKLNPEINVGQPRAGMESSRVFAKPEIVVPVGCDVHPWMRATMAVLPHPFFAVSAKDGAFEIRNVPPGRYEIEARHPKLKPASATVDVTAETAVDLTLSFEP